MTLTAEQLEARPDQFGGSDAAGAFGWSTFTTPYQVWLKKTGRAEERSEDESERMEWGNVFEVPILQHVAAKTGEDIVPSHETVADEEYPFLVCTKDAATSDGRTVYEVKCVDAFEFRRNWELGLTDGIPVYYVTQALQYLGILKDAERVVFLVLVGGNKLHRFEIPREGNEDAIADHRDRAISWWLDHVAADIPPDPTTSADAQQRWKDAIAEKTVDATPEIAGAASQLEYIRRRMQADKDRAEALTLTIQTFMGDAEILPYNETERITWKKRGKQKSRAFRGPWSR